MIKDDENIISVGTLANLNISDNKNDQYTLF